MLVMLTLYPEIARAAGSSKIPQHFQDAYAAQTGATANYAIWFPIVPEIPSGNWANYLVLSNFSAGPVTVMCSFTYSGSQINKTYTLAALDKTVIPMSSLGSGDRLYDAYCLSNSVFGAGALLLVNGSVATAWPPTQFSQ